MRMRTSSWKEVLSRLGFERATNKNSSAASRRAVNANSDRGFAFAVETLEARNMLAIPGFPSPSPIELNPGEPGLTQNSRFDCGGGLDGGPPGLSSTGVRYYDGSIVAYSEFLRSGGIDGLFSLGAVWTPYAGLTTGDNGNRINNSLLPVVRETDTIKPYFAVFSGSSTRWFIYDAGVYNPMFFSNDQLIEDSIRTNSRTSTPRATDWSFTPLAKRI